MFLKHKNTFGKYVSIRQFYQNSWLNTKQKNYYKCMKIVVIEIYSNSPFYQQLWQYKLLEVKFNHQKRNTNARIISYAFLNLNIKKPRIKIFFFKINLNRKYPNVFLRAINKSNNYYAKRKSVKKHQLRSVWVRFEFLLISVNIRIKITDFRGMPVHAQTCICCRKWGTKLELILREKRFLFYCLVSCVRFSLRILFFPIISCN